MVAGLHGLDPRTALAAPAGRSFADDPLPVDGEFPAGLDGCLLQAAPHPATAATRKVVAGPHVFSGIRLGPGGARWHRDRMTARRSRPLGPVPALAPALWPADPRASGPDGPGTVALARPVREPGTARWHTIATYPGLSHAEHLIVGPGGATVHGETFALDDAPLMQAVALTDRYVVVLDLPVTYSRAAALVGARLPYTWRTDRPARIGLLPRGVDRPEPRWLPVDPCYVSHAVNAYDDGDVVILDAECRRRAFAGTSATAADPPHLRRWVLDPTAGAAHTRLLTREPETATVDERVSGRPHRHVFGSVNHGGDGATIIRHDLVTGTSRSGALGPGWRTGRPVFVPDPRRAQEGAGWLLVLAWHAGRRHCELRVLDARDPAGPHHAVVRLPVDLPVDRRIAWVPTGVLPSSRPR